MSVSISDVFLNGGFNSMQSLAELHKTTSELQSFESFLAKAQREQDEMELKRACKEFESYFLQIMFREMRKTSFSTTDGIVPKSNAQEIFQDMLDEEYSKIAASSGGIGIADMMYKQMSKTVI